MKNLVLLLLLVPTAIFSQSTSVSGNFNGHIALPGMKLKVVVHLMESDRNLSGTIDIPEQNAKGLKLDQVKYNKGDVSFTIPDVPGGCQFTGKWKSDKDSLVGTFSQNGASFPMLLKRMNENDLAQQKALIQEKVKKIELYIDSLLPKGNVAGLSVAIIKNNEVILNRGFGYRDFENKVKCDENTLFAIGSCTKAFTTALLATLYDEGSFDWDTPVKNYIPYFGMKDKFANEQITGKDVCTHISGLPRHDLVWYGSTLKRKELVERIKFMEPNKPFRTTWQYNNFMFLTAGVIAEEIMKDSWENLIQKRIFDPIGMKNSKNHFEDFTAASNKSIGYDVLEKKIQKMDYKNIDPMGPAGSIYSTSSDMIEWVRLLLNEGKKDDKVILSENQVKYLLSPKIVMDQPSEAFKHLSYAMGWMVGSYKGKTYIEHGGNIDGFTALVTLIPEEEIGFVILCNKNGSSINELAGLYITDVLVGNEEYDWYEEKIGKPKREQEQKEKEEAKNKKEDKSAKDKSKADSKKGPLHPLKNYAGEFSDPAYGKIKVTFTDNKLSAIYNGLTLTIKHDNFETFIATMLDQEIKLTYFTNSSGKIEWVQIPMDAMSKPITFMKVVPDYLSDKTYMDKILGEYDFSGATLTLHMEKSKFISTLSDGQEYELIPSGENLFKLKGLEGFNMEMVFDEKGNCIKVISHQPNGDYDAKKILKK